MRIDRIQASNILPIRSLDILTPSSVVIVAGANGSGKTRLKKALVSSFQKPTKPQASILLGATRQEEEQSWGTRSLQVTAGSPCEPLTQYLATRKRAQSYVGAVVQIDSDRAVRPVQFEALTLSTADPDDEDISYAYYLNPFVGRWPELVNKIYKKAAARDQKIAQFVKADPTKSGAEALSAHPDPFLQYQEMFSGLLPGKSLDPIDPRAPKEFHYRINDSPSLPFQTLSSGEQEVVKVAFDLVWKRLTHSVILIDEPELHLHPTLTFRLVEVLKEFGGGTNQLIMFTHSADLISTYYSTGSVYFIDSSVTTGNQAHQLSSLSRAHSSVARAASANLGLFAVGKRLVFVEGKDASVDRLVYHKVAQTAFPDAYVMPIGSVENLIALRSVVDEITNAVFGIDLFLIRDRDGLSDESIAMLETNPRFRAIPRRHVENYLLDADVLSEVAAAFYLPSEKRDATQIRSTLASIASQSIMSGVLWNVRETIRVLGAVQQPSIRNVEALSGDELAEAISSQLVGSIETITRDLTPSAVRKLVVAERARLSASIASGEWTRVLPGKPIFARFCGEFFSIEQERVREAYVDIGMRTKAAVFEEIAGILASFARVAS